MYLVVFHGIIVEQSGPEVCNHFWLHVSYLVHGVWCLFQGWDVGTLGNTLGGCVTQDPSEASAIHPTHHVHLVACTSES